MTKGPPGGSAGDQPRPRLRSATGLGFVTYAVIKLLRGRGRELHWMTYLACAAFAVYFCLPLIESAVK